MAALGLVNELHAALQREERARIVEILRKMVAEQVPLGEQWQQIAHIAADNAEIGLSRQAIDLFVAAAGSGPLAQFHKFSFLARIGAWPEAYALLTTLPDTVPEPAAHAYGRGATAVILNQPQEARTQLERVIALRPDLGQAWLPLSAVVDFAADDALTERLLAAERDMERTPPAVRAVYNYALGKAHADRHEHALAAAAFARGAREMKTVAPYSREQDRASAEEATRGYDASGIAAIAREQREPTDRTIFVTGLPRSGTTLVEQILTSHPEVVDGGEINLLRLLSREVGGASFPALSRHVAEHGTGHAAKLWRHWIDERFPEPGRVIDKSIDSGRFLGLAAALLPQAPLIWLTRDPLDRAWSCFRTHFLAGVPWSYDLDDIAFHFRLEDELLARWQDILGDRLLVVPLEDLVDQSDEWIRRILAHCGLCETPQVFAPQDNTRPVTTSSVMQVRRPINRAGIGSAEPYREFLEPFAAAYRKAGGTI